MAPSATKTYGSRTRTTLSSPPSSSPPPTTRKRPALDLLNLSQHPPSKKQKLSKSTKKSTSKPLVQLHFSIDASILKTCRICDLSYTKGAPDDESLHRTHCNRVQRGMEWGKEEQKEFDKHNVTEIESGIKLKNGTQGRIVSFNANVGGKIGAKLGVLLDTINLTLASPALPQSVLDASKAYLFLLSPSSTFPSREKIIGCVIAQRIETAMAIASSVSSSDNLIQVDASTGLFCDPIPLPTPLGIPRMFVSSSHRRQGIVSRLLSAAASTFIRGCVLDPIKGEVAFTQPTGAGKGVMEYWAKGGARIYQE